MKKRLICLIFAVILSVAAFAACADEPDGDDSHLDGLYVMKTEKSEYTFHDEIKITIYNNSGLLRYVDEAYTLYRLKDGAYEQVEGAVFREEEKSHECEAGGEINMSFRLKAVWDEELEPGTYLIRKMLKDSQGEGEAVYARFEIVESE